ncbi:hypothetical protein EVA24_07850 [bacterium]|nr:MAG: hypothetical protein EVA24_07850 [bacterium]
MANKIFYLFLSAMVTCASAIDIIPNNCGMECCEKMQDTCCPSETNSNNCENRNGSCFVQISPSENILKSCNKIEFKKISIFNIPNAINLNFNQNKSLVKFNFKFIKKNITTISPLIC